MLYKGVKTNLSPFFHSWCVILIFNFKCYTRIWV